MKTLIQNIEIINENTRKIGNVLIDNDRIAYIGQDVYNGSVDITIDGRGKILMPGIIDDQVHFREPGLTSKADIESESTAAIAGGVTSFLEMPNTKPQTTTLEALDNKYKRAAECSVANYSFYIGATNDNIDVIKAINYKEVCGIKLFMGSSTGNMLVDNDNSLEQLFAAAPAIIVAHCEDEITIKANTAKYKETYGDNVPWSCHPEIRSAEACYKSSKKASLLARKYNTRLHILHISTAKELDLLDSYSDKSIVTGEACLPQILFEASDYEKLGQYIKCNPAIKSKNDRDALRRAINDGRISVVATDHAPHTFEEKQGTYFNTPSGMPFVQHSLITMLELANEGWWNYETVVERMCHAPAKLFKIKDRGFIRKGYKADLVIIEKRDWIVEKSNILYKCKWSPIEGMNFHNAVYQTFVNGNLVYNQGKINKEFRGERLIFY